MFDGMSHEKLDSCNLTPHPRWLELPPRPHSVVHVIPHTINIACVHSKHTCTCTPHKKILLINSAVLAIVVLCFFPNLGNMGEQFRAWYGQISQLRSLLPSTTPVVALTATATRFVKDRIVHALQMNPVQLITKAANRPNLRYSVERVNHDVYVSFKWLVSDLMRERTSLPRVIVFSRSINMCASLYKMFLTELKEERYEPRASPLSIPSCLFAMYHSRVGDDEKQQILQSMLNPQGNCRVVFSTTAFGMGADVPNIRTVIHLRPPADMDDYFQKCGRAGRDGIQSNAILYSCPGCLIGHVSNNMKEYCKLEDKCHRRMLLQKFIGGIDTSTTGNVKHNCCDVCPRPSSCSVECPMQVCVRQKEHEFVKRGCRW